MFIVFARDTCDNEFWGKGPTPQDAWADLMRAVDGDVVGSEVWFRAEPVKVTQQVIFSVEG